MVIDNGLQYKAIVELLMERCPTFFGHCATQCIDFMLMDIRKIYRVRQVMKTVHSITRFIYNHTWVLALTRKFIAGEILRSCVTWFAVNCISLNSLLERRHVYAKYLSMLSGRRVDMRGLALRGAVEGVVTSQQF